MTDDIIKMKLKEVGLSYILTPKYFQILRESKMGSKAPKWFSDFSKEFVEFRKSVNKRFKRFDILESKVDRNSEMIIDNRNTILKAHPEFKKKI